MVVSTNTIIKLVLLGVIGILLVFIFWPYTPEVPDIQADEMEGTLEEADLNDITSEFELKSPDYPAVLFGWVRPTPVPTRPPTPAPAASPVPTAPVAGWLTATNGTRVDEKGVTWYLFRDGRSNTVYWLCYEQFTKGWKILRELGDRFILLNPSNEQFIVFKE